MLVGGTDVSYGKKFALAAVTIFKYPQEIFLESVYISVAISRIYNYHPGLLFLREAPLLIEACEKLKTHPEIIIVNGHGKAHPFNFGLATVIELSLEIPTIGCVRSPLRGKFEKFVLKRGFFSPLNYQEKTIGIALCTKEGTKPLIISSGGKLPLEKVKNIILMTTSKNRIPTPLKEADKISRRVLKIKETTPELN